MELDNSKYGHREFKNISKEMVPWLEDELENNGCRVERKEWKSKNNSYVVYDYEPFCADGFEINILASSYDYSNLNFVDYIYKERLEKIAILENCYHQNVKELTRR